MELNPVAFTSAPLLRAIATGGWSSKADLARRANRHPNNLIRDLTVLWEAGLISETSNPALTEHAEDQLAALDRAENPDAADGLGVTHAFHADLIPDPDQPRKDFTSDQAVADLEELRDSLIARGRIVQPIAVRSHPEVKGRFIITDGERRWRAAGLVMDAGDWPLSTPVPISIQETDAKETRLSQLTANMVRADMTPLEEADAFADLIDTHGMTTAGIAAEIGMSQKLVQNRLRLRQLSPNDRARMALPEDDPDHLGYKAALKSLMTPRDDTPLVHIGIDPGAAAGDTTAIHDHVPDPRESGSSLAARFDTSVTAAEARTLVEIADWIERAREPSIGSGHYAPIHAVPTTPVTRRLLERGLIGFRSHGPLHHVTVRYSFEGLTEWLTGLGFFSGDRAAALFEVRTRAGGGPDLAERLADSGRYATHWLNSPSTALDAIAEAEPELVAQVIADHGHAAEEAPALIPPSAFEREAQWRVERERAAVARDREVVARFAEDMLKALADARSGAKPFAEAFDGDGSNKGLDALVEAAFGALALSEPGLAGAALAQLVTRGGSQGARYRLERLTLPAIETMMMSARCDRLTVTGDWHDPVEAHVEAEVAEGEDEHEASEPPVADIADRRVPAVPIRQSIDPDFIVCLEDGRKFKSLKRHLRTRYDLSPEQYRARWGLPADYPMVAPNYARARADLARQMGLQESV